MCLLDQLFQYPFLMHRMRLDKEVDLLYINYESKEELSNIGIEV